MHANLKKKEESDIFQSKIRGDLGRAKTLASMDMRDMKQFREMLQTRTEQELIKTYQAQATIDQLKRSLIEEQKKRDEAKKQAAISRKQMLKSEMRACLMRNDITQMRKRVGNHANKCFKNTQSSINLMTTIKSVGHSRPKKRDISNVATPTSPVAFSPERAVVYPK